MPAVPLIDRSNLRREMNALLDVDPRRSAIVQIDMHIRQMDPDWSAFPQDVAAEIVPRTADFLDHGRSLGIPIIHVMVYLRAVETGQFPRSVAVVKTGRPNVPYGAPRRPGYNPGTPEGRFRWDVLPLLGPKRGDYVVNQKKQDTNSFLSTDLEHLIRCLDVDTFFVVGINTNNCIANFCFEASYRNWNTIVVNDCVGSVHGQDLHGFALENLSRVMAFSMPSDMAIAKLGGATVQTEAELHQTRVSSIDIIDRQGLLETLHDGLRLDPSRTALLTVEMTRRRLSDQAPLPKGASERIVANAADVIGIARAAEIPVIHALSSLRPIEVAALEQTKFMDALRRTGESLSPYGLVPSEAADFQDGTFEPDPAISIAPTDYIVRSKKALGSFYATDLEWLLHCLHRDWVVLVGVSTNADVLATAYEANCRGFGVITLEDCTASIYGEDLQVLALQQLARCQGFVMNRAQFAEKLEPRTRVPNRIEQAAPAAATR